MRWRLIDRFVEFESGRRAAALKAVAGAEEQLDDYLPGFPMMSHALIIEGVAQTGGLLVAEHAKFENRVILAKVAKAVFHELALPGDTLRYEAEIEDFRTDGAFVTGRSILQGDGRLQAEIDLFFAHLDDDSVQRDLFDPADFATMMRTLGLYEVGRQLDGSPLEMPERYRQAELAANADFRR